MSGATLTIGGAFNSHNGIVAVPSSFFGDTSTGGSLNQLLENYLLSLTSSITGGTYAFENNDIAAGPGNDFVTVPASVSGSFEEFTNTDSVGGVTTTSVSGPYTVSSGVTDVVVQAPGDVTLAGNGTTNFALFGASSNVNYTQSIGGSASIFAAGGSNAIDITAANVNDTVYSAGNDTVVYNGTGGNDVVNAQGNATTKVFVGGSDAATVTASDNAQVGVLFIQRSGGSLDFINNSSQAQTVFSAAYGSSMGVNSVTVNAGAGGGLYVGGVAGNNSLIGGSGAVTLVGGGSGDVLEGNSSVSNFLFGGSGFETLLGGTGSANNLIAVGLPYPGIGALTASGLASSNGSGYQSFYIGNTNGETLTGSTVTGSMNQYVIESDTTGGATVGGGNLVITNFHAGDYIYLEDAAGTALGSASIYSISADKGPSGGTDIYLTDNTRIQLLGVSAAQISTVSGAHGVVTMYLNS
jgi:hypothetical protein